MSGFAEWLRRLRSGARPVEPAATPGAPPNTQLDGETSGAEAARAPAVRAEPAQDVLRAIRDVDPKDAQSVTAACALLRQQRGTPFEASAVAAVVGAKRAGRAPAALSIAAADVLLQRGENDSALALLAGLDDPSALLLTADVRAAAGELEPALTLVDRVLARDVTFAGARERHERWRTMLGRNAPPVADASVTLLEPALSSVPLRIVGEAGRGGAGVVYEALDERLGRHVALKVYHQPERDRDKIRREARLPVALSGAGIVRVFDADPSNGWIAMEWLDGGSLKHWIVERRTALLLPIERWFVPLARTLARVHAAGFVHADIKPANVLFRSNAEPVLSDFGLAREVGAVVGDGSVGYMSPERLAQRPIAASDDVYALGRVIDAVLDTCSNGTNATTEDCGLDPWRRCAELAQAPGRPADAATLLRSIGVPL